MLISQTYAGKPFASVFPAFSGFTDIKFSGEESFEKIAESCDVVFFALPHGLAALLVDDAFLSKTRVIDLSADFRLKDAAAYDEWYHAPHPNPHMLQTAVYGLPEVRRTDIANARLIANPGCYATCSALSLLPLAAAGLLNPPIVVDAKSGVSGAGRAASLDVHFNECNESIKAYKVAMHRHTPEIEQELSIAIEKAKLTDAIKTGGASASSSQNEISLRISFVPHLIPMQRGILTTSYCQVDSAFDTAQLLDLFKAHYANEPFVVVHEDKMPEIDGRKVRITATWTGNKRTNEAIIAASDR